MDKNSIKKYAVWARRELIERVSQRAMIYGINAKDAGDPNAESVNGHLLSQKEKRQRQALIRNIKAKGHEQVMEEVAYTWFNRFAALRFMEVNGYLPSHIRVFTNDAGEFKPQILAEAIHLELDGLDMNKVYELESANKSEELFKYLLIVQCNALNSILPVMFQRIDDYTELLLPDYLLREGSVIEQMVTTIPEADWTDQVQIIGWLYQYYNTEPKDKVFAELKKNIKITKDNIPAATQLFTPDWIVHYMVENSLGRLWLDGHPNDALKSEWKYYLDEAEQEAEVQAQLDTIRREYATLKPEEIRVIDPCMGSGHILCVLFDTLVRIYEDYGYTAREAAVKIVENNLWGLDIDERAAQLSYFAVMMKARQYDRRFFTRKVQPHIYAIAESNGITSAPMHDMGLNLTQEEYGEAVKQAMRLVEEMHDAKEYGSIINVTSCDWELLRRFAVPRDEDGQLHLDIHGEIEASERLQRLINIAETLAQKYDVVVTNPPYMGNNGMDAKLSDYTKKNYPDTKADMSSVCMERGLSLCKRSGFMSMINIPVWMFITSFEKFRKSILMNNTIVNMVHPGRGIFGSDFGTTCFVIAKAHISGYKGHYNRLFDAQVEVKSIDVRENQFLEGKGEHISCQDDFMKIPSAPIAYWVSKHFFRMFEFPTFYDMSISDGKNVTGDNDRFLRMLWEVDARDIGIGKHYLKYLKGGEYRKWYGNIDYVIDWSEAARSHYRKDKVGRIIPEYLWYKKGISWTLLTSSLPSFRFKPEDSTFDSGGLTIFLKDEHLLNYYMGMFNSLIFRKIEEVINPTINLLIKDIRSIPMPINTEKEPIISRLVQENIDAAKEDWDSFEVSWDFKRHPLVRNCALIKDAFTQWSKECEDRFNHVMENEITLNEMFIEIYGLQEELSPNLLDSDISIRKADLRRDIESLISYAVGCMLGRYSLSKPGLICTNADWDESDYVTFKADKDGIIPICDDEYFADDIVGRFIEFIRTVYGEETLEENLSFVGRVLNAKVPPREAIRAYFINDFFKSHCAIYSGTVGRRPIYWLFDSGKKNGFKCLIYMHRYQPDTIARIRTDYVHEQQSRYRTAVAELEQRINNATTSERVKLSKQLSTLQGQIEEIKSYEEKIHHLADQMISIDLNDGIKRNYEIFKDVLAKL